MDKLQSRHETTTVPRQWMGQRHVRRLEKGPDTSQMYQCLRLHHAGQSENLRRIRLHFNERPKNETIKSRMASNRLNHDERRSIPSDRHVKAQNTHQFEIKNDVSKQGSQKRKNLRQKEQHPTNINKDDHH
uniref:Uncharacterized protein n=1 Tax=Panagrellus redivivus TaxID=6233 RepID=A0A7E4UZS6_PANRE